MRSKYVILDATLATVPRRTASSDIIVLKFGGTAVGATPEQGRIKIARLALGELIERGNWVVAVFSAYRRGRSGSHEKVSVTDLLQSYGEIVRDAPSLLDGVVRFESKLMDVHLQLAGDLKLDGDPAFIDELRADIQHIDSTVETCRTADERIPSLHDFIDEAIENAVRALDDLGLRPITTYTWYLRVIGNATASLCASFNDFMRVHNPQTLAS